MGDNKSTRSGKSGRSARSRTTQDSKKYKFKPGGSKRSGGGASSTHMSGSSMNASMAVSLGEIAEEDEEDRKRNLKKFIDDVGQAEN
mmetsp:Transcript_15366/g.13104  ORF Transcript_15366/g.13104 Transcript_15366/m.13104 type:complete len:87 (+) Transcript_15366:189-449(+)